MAECPSCCHQWRVCVPAGFELRLDGHKSDTSTKGIRTGVFLANHLASTNSLTRTIEQPDRIHNGKLKQHCGPNKQQHTEERQDRQSPV